jgi:nucleotide-binding universal stress UspA family protein
MRILLAIDNSKHSAAAIDAVTSRPWPPETVVRVLYTVEQSVIPAFALWHNTADDSQQERQREIEHANQLTTDVANWLDKAGLACETSVRIGNPRSIIVDEAKEWFADFIIIGSQGYTGIKKLLLGSVAQSVVSHAPCSIEIVRPQDEQAA